MWLKRFFIETPVDFERQCRNRIITGCCAAVLGVITILLSNVVRPLIFMEPRWDTFIPGFYRALGFGLFFAGLIIAIRNRHYLKNDELKKRREIYETDERNRMLGLRCWAYAGYSMFLLLYIGVIVSGLISLTAMKILIIVAVVYALLLLLFRWMLQACM